MKIIWYMIPEIWSTRQNVFHFGPFLPFYTPVCPPFPLSPLPNSPENQNFEKMKKHVEISSFYTSVTKTMILCYVAPEIWHATHVIVIFYFGLFFTLLHAWRYHHFKYVYHKLWLNDVRFLRYGARRTDGKGDI